MSTVAMHSKPGYRFSPQNDTERLRHGKHWPRKADGIGLRWAGPAARAAAIEVSRRSAGRADCVMCGVSLDSLHDTGQTQTDEDCLDAESGLKHAKHGSDHGECRRNVRRTRYSIGT